MPTLDELIELARQYRVEHGFTAEERRQQIISFAYGNVKLHNPSLTLEMVEAEYDRMEAENAM